MPIIILSPYTNLLTVPTTPTIGVVTLSSPTTRVTLSFTSSSSNGGSTITGYRVIGTPAVGNFVTTTSPMTITGLTPGTSYSFKIYAENIVGPSLSSASTSVILIPTVPGATTMGTATLSSPSSTAAIITFTPPASNGGSAITGYRVIGTPTVSNVVVSSSPMTVTGLNLNTSYSFKIYAENIVGSGSSSATSNTITTLNVPSAPTITNIVQASGTSVNVYFNPPTNNGGSSITSYQIYSPDSGIWVNYPGATSPIVSSGLSGNGSTYFIIRAVSAVGTGAWSTQSTSIAFGYRYVELQVKINYNSQPANYTGTIMNAGANTTDTGVRTIYAGSTNNSTYTSVVGSIPCFLSEVTTIENALVGKFLTYYTNSSSIYKDYYVTALGVNKQIQLGMGPSGYDGYVTLHII